MTLKSTYQIIVAVTVMPMLTFQQPSTTF